MATEVIKIIDPDNGSGTNYTSLSAWEAGEQGDLTGARDEIAVAKCRCTGGTADTTRCAVEGWTTDSTRYIKIWTDPSEGYRHAGSYPTLGNKYRLESSADEQETLSIKESYTKVYGIAAKITSNTGRTDYVKVLNITDSISVTIMDCFVYNNRSITNSSGIEVGTSCTGPIYICNNIVVGLNGTNSVGIYTRNETTNEEAYVYNNTVSNCMTGIKTERYEDQDAINNICVNCTADFDGRWRTGKNNSTDLATSTLDALTKSNNRQGQTFTFVSSTDFHLQSSDTGALGYGLNLYNDSYFAFQTDFEGQDRGGSGAQWDIGADEYAAATSGSLPPWMLQRNRRRLNILLRLCLSTFNLIGRCFK